MSSCSSPCKPDRFRWAARVSLSSLTLIVELRWSSCCHRRTVDDESVISASQHFRCQIFSCRSRPREPRITMAKKLAGGCACGSIRYQLLAQPRFVNCCHRTDCQRLTGSAFVIKAIIETQAIKLLRGKPVAVPGPRDDGPLGNGVSSKYRQSNIVQPMVEQMGDMGRRARVQQFGDAMQSQGRLAAQPAGDAHLDDVALSPARQLCRRALRLPEFLPHVSLSVFKKLVRSSPSVKIASRRSPRLLAKTFGARSRRHSEFIT